MKWTAFNNIKTDSNSSAPNTMDDDGQGADTIEGESDDFEN
jgi:hypothetical protein